MTDLLPLGGLRSASIDLKSHPEFHNGFKLTGIGTCAKKNPPPLPAAPSPPLCWHRESSALHKWARNELLWIEINSAHVEEKFIFNPGKPWIHHSHRIQPQEKANSKLFYQFTPRFVRRKCKVWRILDHLGSSLDVFHQESLEMGVSRGKKTAF